MFRSSSHSSSYSSFPPPSRKEEPTSGPDVDAPSPPQRRSMDPFRGVYNPHQQSASQNNHFNADGTRGGEESASESSSEDSSATARVENIHSSLHCSADDSEGEVESRESNDKSELLIDADSTWCHTFKESRNNTAGEPTSAASEAVIATTGAIAEDRESPSYLKHGWIGAGMLVLLAVTCTTGISLWQKGLYKQDQWGKQQPETISPTSTPTSLPTRSAADFPWDSLGDYHESLLQTILASVESSSTTASDNFLDSYSWTTRGTPQFKALRFVAYQDGAVPGGGDMGYYGSGSSGLMDIDDTGLLLQRLALLILYYQTGGEFSWTSTSTGEDRLVRQRYLEDDTGSNNWLTPGVDECFWEGVDCDEGYRVTHLFLRERGLAGTIPTETWIWLPHLQLLDASNNRLAGKLPSEIFWPFSNDLQQQQQQQQSQSTQVPPPLVSVSKQVYLPHLNHLDLSFNELEGNLPMDLKGGLPSLQILNLSHNRLTGALPTEYNKEVLEQLHLSSNKLTGSLPFAKWFVDSLPPSSNNNDQDDNIVTKDTDNVNSLLLLDLGNNLLSGTIHESLGNHPGLKFLSIENNPLLSGSLPQASMFRKLPSLTVLLVSDCDLEGSLTDALGELLGLPRLERLSMAGNRLTGSIPTLNELTGENERSLPPSVLEALNLGNNAITGTIPPGLIGDRLTNLEHLQLFGNDLKGTIPESRFHPSVLSVLWLHENPNLMGTMPCGFLTIRGADEAVATGGVSEFDGGSAKENQDSTAHGEAVHHDYRADCWVPARVECSCCRRCF